MENGEKDNRTPPPRSDEKATEWHSDPSRIAHSSERDVQSHYPTEAEESENQDNADHDGKSDNNELMDSQSDGDGRKPAATATEATPTPSTTDATTTDISKSPPPRSDRAKRLARKREQLNCPGHGLTPLPASLLPPATPRARLPPMTNVETSSPRTDLPGDKLDPSAAIATRARPPPPVFSSTPETPPSGPLPPGPRLKGGTPALNKNPNVDLTPGAYQERARAVGDLPCWIRNELATAAGTTTNGGTHAPEPMNDNNPMSVAITNLEDLIEDSGLATAEPVAEGETVVYAEDIKEDEIVLARRKFLILACASMVIIGALVVGLIMVLSGDGTSKNECDLPIEEQTISMYCRCHNTSEGYMDYFNKTDKYLFQRYGVIRSKLEGSDWMRPDTNFSMGSCDVENMVLQSMALISKGLTMDEFKESQRVMGDLVHLRQMFAIQSLYFSLNGDGWTRKYNWLLEPNLCGWEGLECDFPTKVSTIRLPQNKLKGTIPSYISVAPSLKKLDLSGNEIYGQLPSQLNNLTSLREIILSDLQLNGTIPTELGSMSGLHTLDLTNNSLAGTLPSQLRYLRLFTLRLDFNKLTGRVPRFGAGDRNRRMRFFSVRHNALNGTLPAELFELNKLEFIDLSYNSFEGKPPDFCSGAPDLQMVNFIDSGFSGYLPDPYCQNKSQVQVLAACRGQSDIYDCRCCPDRSSEVLLCRSELDKVTLEYVTGYNWSD